MTWEMVHFDVQLIGGIALHHGKIAEMATGEGKTLVATLPLFLNALTGRGVHLVTVNDYLARRDSEWMGFLLRYLGLSVGVYPARSVPQRTPRPIRLRCHLRHQRGDSASTTCATTASPSPPTEQVQRGHWFAIVDEVDSVLIDEARTPLIISGPVTSGLPPVRQIQTARRKAGPAAGHAAEPNRRRSQGDGSRRRTGTARPQCSSN